MARSCSICALTPFWRRWIIQRWAEGVRLDRLRAELSARTSVRFSQSALDRHLRLCVAEELSTAARLRDVLEAEMRSEHPNHLILKRLTPLIAAAGIELRSAPRDA